MGEKDGGHGSAVMWLLGRRVVHGTSPPPDRRAAGRIGDDSSDNTIGPRDMPASAEASAASVGQQGCAGRVILTDTRR